MWHRGRQEAGNGRGLAGRRRLDRAGRRPNRRTRGEPAECAAGARAVAAELRAPAGRSTRAVVRAVRLPAARLPAITKLPALLLAPARIPALVRAWLLRATRAGPRRGVGRHRPQVRGPGAGRRDARGGLVRR